jgi:hypothetical protein
MPIEEILKISQGLLTPVIGIVATYIAWQQKKATRIQRFHTNSQRKESGPLDYKKSEKLCAAFHFN